MIAKKQFIKWLLCCLSFAPLWATAQDNCTQKLRSARNYYQEGKLNLLPDLLTNCIKDGFTKEEKIEALRLVTLAHLYSEDEVKAEQIFLELLTNDPEFTPNLKADPTELILLAEKFDTDPKLFWGFNGGIGYNMTQVISTQNNNVELSEGSYQFTTTLGVGAFFTYPFTMDWSGTVEAYFLTRTTTLLRQPLPQAENSNSQTISESQSWLEFPLLANYRIPYKPILLELTAGPAIHYLLAADVSSESDGDTFQNEDFTSDRSTFNLSGIVGLRANFKVIGRNYLTLALLYQHRFLKEVNVSSEKSNKEIATELASAYQDSQFKNHVLWLKIGLRFPYYNPKLK